MNFHVYIILKSSRHIFWGNILEDEWVSFHTSQKKRCRKNWAASSKKVPHVLSRCHTTLRRKLWNPLLYTLPLPGPGCFLGPDFKALLVPPRWPRKTVQPWEGRQTDRRTDGQTDGQTDATKYIISLASRSIIRDHFAWRCPDLSMHGMVATTFPLYSMSASWIHKGRGSMLAAWYQIEYSAGLCWYPIHYMDCVSRSGIINMTSSL